MNTPCPTILGLLLELSLGTPTDTWWAALSAQGEPYWGVTTDNFPRGNPFMAVYYPGTDSPSPPPLLWTKLLCATNPWKEVPLSRKALSRGGGGGWILWKFYHTPPLWVCSFPLGQNSCTPWCPSTWNLPLYLSTWIFQPGGFRLGGGRLQFFC